MDESEKSVQSTVGTMLDDLNGIKGKRYDKRMGEWLMEQWNRVSR